MALKDREVELVSTETGHRVHAYWPHARRTPCGLSDAQVFPFVLILDADFDPCWRCARWMPPVDEKTDA